MELPQFNKVKDSSYVGKETRSDRCLALVNERGYTLKDGLILHDQLEESFGTLTRIVIPKSLRQQVMTIAHKYLGHQGAKKMQRELARQFVWPGITKDISLYSHVRNALNLTREVLGVYPWSN